MRPFAQPRRPHTSPLPAAVGRFLRHQQANALVELAVFLSLLGIPLLLGTVYTSGLILGDIQITNAAHTAALYAMTSSTFAQNNSGIIAAARAEAPGFGTGLSVTPSIFYACSAALSGTRYSTQSAANSACTGGTNHSLEFVQVIASATVTPPCQIPPLPPSATLSSVSIMEVEE